MVNIIKNINPPIDLTQSEYNSLSTEQKNGGNIFYVEDGTQIKQNASTLETNDSNVQTELNTFNNSIDEIETGQQKVYCASYIRASYEGGYHTDVYGNFIHNSTTTTNSFTILPYDASSQTGSAAYPFRAYFQTGQIRCKNQKDWVIGKDQTITCDNWRGNITYNNKQIFLNIPLLTAATSATITKISSFYLPNNAGNYAYMKYGTNAGSSVQLNNVTLWQNSVEKYANSINSISSTIQAQQIRIVIRFKNTPVTTSAGTTNLSNYIPIHIIASFTINLS